MTALAWVERAGKNTQVYVAIRSPGRRFGAPIRLATHRGPGASRPVSSAAVGARGDVLVAWDRVGVTRARFKARSRRSFEAVDTIRTAGASANSVRTVFAPSGLAAVGWVSRDSGRSLGFCNVAVRPARSRQFDPPQPVEPTPPAFPEFSVPGFDLITTRAGRLAAACTGWDGANFRARFALADAAGRFAGSATDVSPPGRDANVSDLAGSANRELLLWDSQTALGASPSHRVDAAVVGGAPETISPEQAGSSAVGLVTRRGYLALFASNTTDTNVAQIATRVR